MENTEVVIIQSVYAAYIATFIGSVVHGLYHGKKICYIEFVGHMAFLLPMSRLIRLSQKLIMTGDRYDIEIIVLLACVACFSLGVMVGRSTSSPTLLQFHRSSDTVQKDAIIDKDAPPQPRWAILKAINIVVMITFLSTIVYIFMHYNSLMVRQSGSASLLTHPFFPLMVLMGLCLTYIFSFFGISMIDIDILLKPPASSSSSENGFDRTVQKETIDRLENNSEFPGQFRRGNQSTYTFDNFKVDEDNQSISSESSSHDGLRSVSSTSSTSLTRPKTKRTNDSLTSLYESLREQKGTSSELTSSPVSMTYTSLASQPEFMVPLKSGSAYSAAEKSSRSIGSLQAASMKRSSERPPQPTYSHHHNKNPVSTPSLGSVSVSSSSPLSPSPSPSLTHSVGGGGGSVSGPASIRTSNLTQTHANLASISSDSVQSALTDPETLYLSPSSTSASFSYSSSSSTVPMPFKRTNSSSFLSIAAEKTKKKTQTSKKLSDDSVKLLRQYMGHDSFEQPDFISWVTMSEGGNSKVEVGTVKNSVWNAVRATTVLPATKVKLGSFSLLK